MGPPGRISPHSFNMGKSRVPSERVLKAVTDAPQQREENNLISPWASVSPSDLVSTIPS